MPPINSLSKLESLLQRFGTPLDPFEFHGTISGMACTKGAPSLDEWRSLLGIEIDPGNLLHTEAVKPLLLEMRAIDTALADPMLSFTPLLPDEDEPLVTRITALAHWCQGFTLGLSSDSNFRPEKLSQEAREVVDDLLDISRLGEDSELSGDDDDEAALLQIIEYVRMGVLTLRDELVLAAPPPPPSSNTIH